MELKERSPEARAAYLEGYRAGEDNMQLQVLRILQGRWHSIMMEPCSLSSLGIVTELIDGVKIRVLNIPLLSCLTNPEGKKENENPS